MMILLFFSFFLFIFLHRDVWSKSKTCGGDGSFNYVMQPGIAVSNGGEIVAVGSWGCLDGSNDDGSGGGGSGSGGGEILAFVGRNGKSNGTIYFFFLLF